MCKYCKNLKRIKDLDEKEYKNIIQKWKEHVYLGERIMCEAKVLLTEMKYFDAVQQYEKKYVLKRIEDYLNTKYIGQ